MQKGFVSIPVLVYVAIGVLVTAGTGIGIYQYQEVRQENAQIKAELEEQRDKEIERLEAELEGAKQKQEIATTTIDESWIEPEIEPETKINDRVTEIQVVTPTPSQVMNDICANLEGIQEAIPPNHRLIEGNCVAVIDLCSNLSGTQETVPEGYRADGGSCKEIGDKCNNIPGIQEDIPAGDLLTREFGCVSEAEYEELLSERQTDTNSEREIEESPSFSDTRSRELEEEITDRLSRQYAEVRYLDRYGWTNRSRDLFQNDLNEYQILNPDFSPPSRYDNAETLKDFVDYWELWMSMKYNHEFDLPYEDYRIYWLY